MYLKMSFLRCYKIYQSIKANYDQSINYKYTFRYSYSKLLSDTLTLAKFGAATTCTTPTIYVTKKTKAQQHSSTATPANSQQATTKHQAAK